MKTGSNLDRNQREFIELPSAVIDNGTVLAVERAVKATQPGADVVLLGARDPALFALRRKSLEEGSGTQGMVARLSDVLGGTQATHLILITKLHHDAMLKLESSHVGSGKLEGVGFYIDHALRTTRSDTGARGQGFLAPFAYFTVSLIDLRSRTTLAEEDVVASTTHSAARSDTLHPWDAMNADQKVRELQRLIRTEIARVTPELLKK
ncbi:MAG: hypothetical protein ABIQ84_04910 [Usitatibacter sp.]